jgi:hypothetical protein
MAKFVVKWAGIERILGFGIFEAGFREGELT